MMTISGVRERIDRKCREAVKAGLATFHVPVEEWALISIACADAVSGRDRVTELLNANGREVARRRAAEAAARSIREANRYMAQAGFALGVASGLPIGVSLVALVGWLT